jgi:hypothetical protein
MSAGSQTALPERAVRVTAGYVTDRNRLSRKQGQSPRTDSPSLPRRRSHLENQVAAGVGSGRSDTPSGPLNQGATLLAGGPITRASPGRSFTNEDPEAHLHGYCRPSGGRQPGGVGAGERSCSKRRTDGCGGR